MFNSLDINSKFSNVATFGIRDSKPYCIRSVKIGKLVKKNKRRRTHTRSTVV